MSVETETELEVLEREARKLEDEGFDVFIKPRASQTPAFLGNFIPDAIAVGNKKKLVLEVKRGSPTADAALKRLSERFAEQNEWELRIVLVSPRRSAAALPIQTSQEIEGAITEIKKLRDAGMFRPSFLMAWATLEAEARRLLGDAIGRPQTPARVIQMLGQEGLLLPDDVDAVRGLAEKRNRLIHGELSAHLSHENVDLLLRALKQLQVQNPHESERSK